MSINIQLDGKLQKISGQTMTKEKIVEKLGYTPANESTINTAITNLESTVDADIAAVNADLSDLRAALENYIKDHPDIVEDGSGEVVFTDEAGNIIAKLDADGFHTTNVEADSFISNDDNLIINDLDGNKIFQVDKNGVETTKLKLASGDIDDQLATYSAALAAHAGDTASHVTAKEKETWNNKSDFSGNYSDLVGAPDIVEDESGAVVYTDEPGNIIFKIDSDGAHTTKLELTSGDVDNQFADLRADLAAHTGDTKIHVTTEDKNRWNNKSDFSGDFNDLTNSPFEEDNSGEINYVDESGNIIFKIDGDGAHTTELTLTGGKVDERINNLSANFAAHEAKKDGKDADLVHITPAERVLWNAKVDAEYVKTEIANLVNSAPDALNTLDELAAALGDDENFATTVTSELAKKVNNDDFVEHEAAFAAHKSAATAHTKAQVGLSNVDNTSDADKPVSTATQTALDNLKTELSESITSESDSWTIVDESGNIMLKAGQLDNDVVGLETTTIKAETADIANIYNKEEVDAALAAKTYTIKANAEDDDVVILTGTSGANEVSYKAAHAETNSEGTYRSVTVNKYGHVTGGSNPTTIKGYKISDAYTMEEVDAAVAAVDAKVGQHEVTTQQAIADLKTELSEEIVSESNSWTIVDNSGNILLKAGELDDEGNNVGLETTTIKATKAEIGNIYNKTEIDAEVTALDEAKSDKGHTHAISAAAEDDNFIHLEGTSGTLGVSYKATHADPAANTETDKVYTKVSVDVKGHITSGSIPTTLAGYSISDAYTKEEVKAAIAAVTNQNAFSNITVGESTVKADSIEDTLTFVGENIAITPNLLTDTITFKVEDATIGTKGIVELDNSISSDSDLKAATSSSVKQAYDLADDANAAAARAAEAAAHSHPYLSNTTKYAGSSSAGGAATSANKVNKALTVQLDSGTTEDTDKFVFDGSAAKAINITPAAIGAAEASLSTRVADNESDIAAIKAGIAGGVHFIGTVSAKPTSSSISITKDGTTKTVTAIAGDVVIWTAEGIEYIYTGTSWEELGDITRLGDLETKVKNLKTTATNAVATTHKFVSQVTQSEGQVAVTYTRPDATDVSYDSTYSVKDKLDTIGAAVAAAKVNVIDDLNSTSATDALSANQGRLLNEAIRLISTDLGDLGGGDMMKSVYDKDGNGIVDDAEKLGGQAPGYYATKTELGAVEAKIPDVVGEPNTINTIKVNGTALPVDSQKAVDITVPTYTSQLTNNSGFITSIPSEYVTETELTAKGYLTTHQDISHLATTSYVDDEIRTVGTLANTANTTASTAATAAANAQTTATEAKNAVAGIKIPTKVSELENDSKYLDSIPSEYVTEGELSGKGYLTAQDIKIPTKVSELTNDSNYLTAVPSEYITEGELNAKGYLTDQDLTDYTTKTYVATEIANAQLAGEEVDLSGYVTEDELAAALPDIKNDESHNLIIQDNAGNIITAIDATGITTTTVTVDSLIINGEIFSIISDEEIIEMFNEE